MVGMVVPMASTTSTSRTRTRPKESPRTEPAGTEPLSVAGLVDATPVTRDRYVDFLRALSIVVVILWHWVFSITQWDDQGSLVMPNPIGDVPGLWLATWMLQIMPVFFFVGGFANLAGIEGNARRGDTRWSTFVRSRLGRLGRPVGVYVGCWVAIDVIARLTHITDTSVLHWGMVVFIPLWFLGVYVGVVLLAPLTARLHQVGRELTLVALGGAIAIADLARFRFDMDRAGLVGSALVWVFAHQLGYFWKDGTFTRWPRRSLWALTLGALATLAVLTNLGVYPRSMVSLAGEGSNMFPTTACIAALAVFQIGVAMLLRPRAERWLQGRRAWTLTVMVNAVAMTVFCWHMTALVAAIALYQRLGGELGRIADAAWWAQRPLWLILPALVLAPLVALFARVELRGTNKR